MDTEEENKIISKDKEFKAAKPIKAPENQDAQKGHQRARLNKFGELVDAAETE